MIEKAKSSESDKEEELKKIHSSILDGIKRNEEAFESKITYLGGGAIALSLAYVSTQEILKCKVLFFVSIAALIIALGINFGSTIYGSCRGTKMLGMIKGAITEERKKTNKSIRRMNATSGAVLMLGIALMAVLISINVNKSQTMEDKKNATYESGNDSRVINKGYQFEETYQESTQTSDSDKSSDQAPRDE